MSNAAIPRTKQIELRLSGDVDVVVNYINQIWNQKRFEALSDYLDDDYADHSIPYLSFQNKEGLLLYLRELALTVSHKTEIVGLTTLGELVICHIRITVSGLVMADKVSEGTEVFYGYRTFRMCNGKIAEHWEII